MCSKNGFNIIMSAGIIDLHHINRVTCINVMSRRVVMVACGSM